MTTRGRFQWSMLPLISCQERILSFCDASCLAQYSHLSRFFRNMFCIRANIHLESNITHAITPEEIGREFSMVLDIMLYSVRDLKLASRVSKVCS